jgi:transposase-like protein
MMHNLSTSVQTGCGVSYLCRRLSVHTSNVLQEPARACLGLHASCRDFHRRLGNAITLANRHYQRNDKLER